MTPPRLNLVDYFVIEAALPGEERAYYMVIGPGEAREAHDVATMEFRKKRGIRPNITVHTKTFFRGTEDQCRLALKIIEEQGSDATQS